MELFYSEKLRAELSQNRGFVVLSIFAGAEFSAPDFGGAFSQTGFAETGRHRPAFDCLLNKRLSAATKLYPFYVPVRFRAFKENAHG
jgi:hypothetical protein